MIPTGIYNVGNTCYLNCALQVLFFTPQLTNIILFFKDNFVDDTDNNVASSFIEIIHNLYKCKRPKVNSLMEHFLIEFKYFQNMKKQHDSHETIMCILDSISDSMKKENKFIEDIFDTVVVNRIQCKGCDHEVVNDETIRNLCISSTCESVQDGISNFFKEEKMDDYKCDVCKETCCYQQRTHKKHGYISMININMYDNYGEKVKCIMSIDQEIFISGKRYDLYACVCHHGSANNGHYTASVKSDNEWYIIDDESVHKVEANKKNLCLKNAYTLFYKVV